MVLAVKARRDLGPGQGAQDKGLHVRDAGDDWVSGDPRWEL